MTTEQPTPPAVVLSTAQLGRNLDMYAELMAEAALLIEAIPLAVFDKIKRRYPLCDELGGAAGMAKDDADALREFAKLVNEAPVFFAPDHDFDGKKRAWLKRAGLAA